MKKSTALLDLLVVVLLVQLTEGSSKEVCNSRRVDDDPNRVVCVCSETSCPNISFQWPKETGEAILVTSTRKGKRFEISNVTGRSIELDNSIQITRSTINVYLNRKQQSILGWGGAVTDAAGSNLLQLSKDLADKLIESYYGKDGLEYNFARVPIAGSDFSSRAYSYDDTTEPDYELEDWHLTREDLVLKIPTIKEAMKIAQRSNITIKLLASPWSPPEWMKTNHRLVRGSLIDDERIYKSYANYLMKFYGAYKNYGIDFWGATVQNEPIASFNPLYYYNSLHFTNDQMIKFISKFLGPALRANGYTKENFKLFVGDDSLGLINLQVPSIMRNKEVQKYVSGLAFHWYMSGYIPYDALNRVYEEVKDKIEFVIMSEACTGSVPGLKKVDFGSWDRGEAYAADIIEDLRRHTSAWIDWNLALDMNGGPNWSGNFVDSPILVDKEKNEFYRQPMYYALAHFSKLFRPESVVLKTLMKSLSTHQNRLLSIAAITNNSSHVIVNILNRSNDIINVDIKFKGLTQAEELIDDKELTIEARSINSLIIKI